ncbi:MAG: oligosaccharide flippase family protein [Patescibacteria group bacterium]
MFDLFFQIKDLVLSKTAKETGIMFFGNISSFLFGILFTVIAARLIAPEGWGIAAGVMGFVVILSSFADLGLTSGLFRFVSGLVAQGKRLEAYKMQSFIFTLRIISSLVFVLFLLLFPSLISRTFFRLENPAVAYIAALGLFGLLLIDFQITTFQSKGRWRPAAVFSALTNFFRLVILLTLSSLNLLNLITFLLTFFASPLLSFILTLFWERPRLFFPKNFRKAFSQVSKFSSWLGLNRIVGATTSRVDALLLLQLATPSEAGIVGVARQLANAVLILLSSFATVIAPRFSSYTGKHLKKYYGKTILFSIMLSVGVLLGTLLVEPVTNLLGPKYRASAGVLTWLLIGLIPFSLSAPFVNALIYSYKKPQAIALLSTVQLPLVIFGNFYFIPRYGIFGPVIVIGLWNLSTLLVTSLFSSYYFSKK